jgi:hypothetical protein
MMHICPLWLGRDKKYVPGRDKNKYILKYPILGDLAEDEVYDLCRQVRIN